MPHFFLLLYFPSSLTCHKTADIVRRTQTSITTQILVSVTILFKEALLIYGLLFGGCLLRKPFLKLITLTNEAAFLSISGFASKLRKIPLIYLGNSACFCGFSAIEYIMLF